MLGKGAYLKKDFPFAARLLKESLAKRPQDGDLLYYAGRASIEIGAAGEGGQFLRQAVQLPLDAGLKNEANRVLAQIKK